MLCQNLRVALSRRKAPEDSQLSHHISNRMILFGNKTWVIASKATPCGENGASYQPAAVPQIFDGRLDEGHC